MLATSVHSQPGVYALLLGSGVSTGAGIPTGWGVIQALVRRLAAATEPHDPDAADRAAQDPDGWWSDHGDGNPLGYSNLLAAVAPTPAARRGLLAGFFEPSEDDAEAGFKVPGPAHRAIADLAKRGLVRVILTTNFDRLIERALEDAGHYELAADVGPSQRLSVAFAELAAAVRPRTPPAPGPALPGNNATVPSRPRPAGE